MIAVIDYNMGNIRSVENALRRLGAEFVHTADPAIIRQADKVLLPGVGHCGEAMANLRDRDLCDVIRDLRHPVLGICVGLQVMCRHTEEGDVDCLGIFDTKVRKFVGNEGLKVPHMGWNQIANLDNKKLFKDIERGEFMYFVHSYYAPLCPDTIATTNYGGLFSSALKYENFFATQFHPEKSGDAGEKILRNFLEL